VPGRGHEEPRDADQGGVRLLCAVQGTRADRADPVGAMRSSGACGPRRRRVHRSRRGARERANRRVVRGARRIARVLHPISPHRRPGELPECFTQFRLTDAASFIRFGEAGFKQSLPVTFCMPPDPTAVYYLALGDSLAVDVAAQNYPERLLAEARTQVPPLQLVDIGCAGATTAGMLGEGEICRLAGERVTEPTRTAPGRRGEGLPSLPPRPGRLHHDRHRRERRRRLR
jgi:hypothetical protein